MLSPCWLAAVTPRLPLSLIPAVAAWLLPLVYVCLLTPWFSCVQESALSPSPSGRSFYFLLSAYSLRYVLPLLRIFRLWTTLLLCYRCPFCIKNFKVAQTSVKIGMHNIVQTCGISPCMHVWSTYTYVYYWVSSTMFAYLRLLTQHSYVPEWIQRIFGNFLCVFEIVFAHINITIFYSACHVFIENSHIQWLSMLASLANNTLRLSSMGRQGFFAGFSHTP